MKRLLIVICVLSVLTGCKLWDAEEKNKGTVKGVAVCVDKNKKQSEISSTELIKTACIKKHQQRSGPYGMNMSGEASIWGVEEVYFQAKVKNKMSSVVTAVHLEWYFYDLSGNKINGKEQWFYDLWLEPGKETKQLRMEDTPKPSTYSYLEPLNYCKSNLVGKSCKTWKIKNSYQLKLTLD